MGIDNYTQDGTTFIPPYAYSVSSAFYGGGPSLDPTQNGYASTGINNSFLINHDLNLTYNWKISTDLASVTQLGYSLQYQNQHYALQQGRGMLPSAQIPSEAVTPMQGAELRNQLSIWGEFIQQNFKYKNQLFLTGALRMDGSSVFGPNERDQLYAKLSGSYVLSGTDFWNKMSISKWWNLFKLRAAYGQSGNLTGLQPYARFNTYQGSSFIGSASFQSSSTYTDPNVKPERQAETEIGTDLGFLDNRINVSFNWYRKNVSDLLISRSVNPTLGYANLLSNIGSLQNAGYEAVLNITPVKTKSFTWDLTAIYNHNKNKAINIGQSLILPTATSGAPSAIIGGQPIGVFYGTFFATDATGNILKNSAGIPLTELGTQTGVLTYTPGRDPATGLPTGNTTLQKVIGDPNPKYTATFTNEFQYKKFGLRVQLDAVEGLNVFNSDFRTRQGVDNGKIAEAEDLGQLPRGYIAGVYQIQQWRVDDGSFVKLREISLSYSFGKLKWIEDLSINLGGRNLISWDKYNGYDPEVNAGGQSATLRGVDFGTVPIPRTFSLGLRAKF
jgi:outer membrane receptor protein involved in Fe transport